MHENKPTGQPSSKSKRVLWVSLIGLAALVIGAYVIASNKTEIAGSGLSELDRVKQEVAAGDRASMHKLGRFFEEGINIPRSYSEAMRYYSLASEAGDLASRYDYARLLASDKAGTQMDVDKAYKLLLDLANRGNESAQFGLAYFYRYKKRDATGGANLVEAYAWANVVLAGRGERAGSERISIFDYSDVRAYSFESIAHFRNDLEGEISKESLGLAQSRSAEIFKAIEESRLKK